MAKLVIGNAPKQFPLAVVIPTPHGPDDALFDANHLRSTVWAEMREAHSETVTKAVAALFDKARKAAESEYAASQRGKKDKVDPAAKESAIVVLIKPTKESDLAKLKATLATELMLKIVTGWDLEEEFSAKSLHDMCELYPAAADAIFAKYSETLQGLREGN